MVFHTKGLHNIFFKFHVLESLSNKPYSLSVHKQPVKRNTTATRTTLERNKAIQKQPPSGVLYKKSS